MHTYRYVVLSYQQSLRPGTESRPIAVVVQDDGHVFMMGVPNSLIATSTELGSAVVRNYPEVIRSQVLEAQKQGRHPVEYIAEANTMNLFASDAGERDSALEDVELEAYHLLRRHVMPHYDSAYFMVDEPTRKPQEGLVPA